VSINRAQETITKAVTEWEGVTVRPHRFGGVEYVIGKREIGHIHGDHLVDIPFPKKVREEVVRAGRAQPHHILPDSGWISLGADIHPRHAAVVAFGEKTWRYPGSATRVKDVCAITNMAQSGKFCCAF
jgi:hypothetical protein